MVKLLATYEVRGRPLGESHGGLFVIDLANRTAVKKLDWAESRSDLRVLNEDLGMRGVACDADAIYVATSDSLQKYSRDFRPLEAWQNAYLKHCHEMHIHRRRLFIASTGFDSILGFDLDRQAFDWALHVDARGHLLLGKMYDPQAEDGPLLLGKLDISHVHCDANGMYMSGSRTGGMLYWGGREIRMSAELPGGSRNARPFRDGVLFTEHSSGLLRYTGRGEGREDRALRIRESCVGRPERAIDEDSDALAVGAARGLCVLSDALVAVGSCPASVTIFDLARNEQVFQVTLSKNPNTAVHSVVRLSEQRPQGRLP